jgi:DNA gyrase subunit A
MGIAVGMATNIPPHNLTELINAIKHLLLVSNPEEVTVEDLMEFIK